MFCRFQRDGTFPGHLVRTGVALTMAAMAAVATAQAESLKNWFNDPFFQVGDSLPHCPKPLGPLMTEAEMKAEAHSRIERGTSCWMGGQCKQPNAYLYDAGIAAALRQRAEVEPAFKEGSLWITIKRRFVWAEGCVKNADQAKRIESVLKEVPDVDRVFVNVMTGERGLPPYPVLNKRSPE